MPPGRRNDAEVNGRSIAIFNVAGAVLGLDNTCAHKGTTHDHDHSSSRRNTLRELIRQDNETGGLLVYMRGGDSHGYHYGMAFESMIAEDDSVIEKVGLMIVLDSQSASLLQRAEVEYWDRVQGSEFSIKTFGQRQPASAEVSSTPD